MQSAELGTAASVDAVLTKSEYSAPILSTPMAHHTKPHLQLKPSFRSHTKTDQNGPKRTKTDQNGPQVEAANQVQQVRNKVKRA